MKINGFLHLGADETSRLKLFLSSDSPSTRSPLSSVTWRGDRAGQGHKGLALTQLPCDAEQAPPSLSFRFSI